ncbi:hypothetical protein [Nannocystis sp.]|uniref:helix-turn-helix domain-containing protein n=1 Tax=Nannocystis sp. TaxID=1962667 RepID=UPI0025D4C92B|nr:hypothetical protein [Nannocystis sp.]MBK7826434.1 hypothetical protein [Nannocystis sp.]
MHADDEPAIHLLLSHADDHRPTLADGLPGAAIREPSVETEELAPLSFYDVGAAGNDLEQQGWGVLAPTGDHGDAMLAAIAPLIAHRAAQQDRPVRIYRVPPRMSASQAARWRKQVFNIDEPEDIPYYQLLLGDLDELSGELQQVQSLGGCVGRLAFTSLADYESYAAKVLRWELAPPQVGPAPALFHTVHDGSAATTLGHRSLVAPVLSLAHDARSRARFPADLHELGDSTDPSPDDLLAHVDAPGGLLFSLSHGDGAPRQGWRSEQDRRSGQGAMSFGRAGSLRGADLAARPFMPGGVWFMFACFGAGTPDRSRFHHWLAHLAALGKFRGNVDAVLASLPRGDERPFVADLPRTLLANPEGPLAFIGHLDLAWSYAFMEMDDSKAKRPAKFYNVLRALVRGDRAGIAAQELTRFYSDTNDELAELHDAAEAQRSGGQPTTSDPRLGHLWMLRQDLAGYILLGDPAVQLPRGEPHNPVRPADPKNDSTHHWPTTITTEPASSPASRSPAPAVATPLALPALESAIHALLAGDEPALAVHLRELGLDRPTLERWRDRYTAAGRDALARHLRDGD